MMRVFPFLLGLMACCVPAITAMTSEASAEADLAPLVSPRPKDAPEKIRPLPRMGWDHRREARSWTRTVLAAILAEEASLVTIEPEDVGAFCPGYAKADPAGRAAFWAGMLSIIARHESRWNPKASGSGGRYLGLLQISPESAAAAECDLSAKAGLLEGETNLACGVRLATRQVRADGVVVGRADRWGGLADEWPPLREEAVRADVARWLRRQSYCKPGG